METVNTELVIRNYMLYFMLPMWMVPGFLDYWCHRKSSIETTSGIKEAIIHWLFVIELSVPILMGLFLEINALVILLMIIAFLVHEATTIWDVVYATQHRHVTPFEQHVHDYLVVVPFMAMSFVICLRWNQFLALFGLGPETARFTLELKQHPVPLAFFLFFMPAFTIFTIIPYTDEILRCYRASKKLAGQKGLVAESVQS